METVGTRFQCLVESSVFNGDTGLIRQAHGELDGILIKVVAAFAEDIECPKHARPCLHWQTHQGPSPLSLNRCPMFREEPLLSRGVRSDGGLATRRHMPADGFPDWYAFPSHGLKGPWGRSHAHQLPPFQHTEASLPLKDHRGGFGNGIEDGWQVQTTRQSLRHCDESLQPLLPLLGLLIELGIADSHRGLGHEAIEEITVIRIKVERLLATQRQYAQQRVVEEDRNGKHAAESMSAPPVLLRDARINVNVGQVEGAAMRRYIAYPAPPERHLP